MRFLYKLLSIFGDANAASKGTGLVRSPCGPPTRPPLPRPGDATQQVDEAVTERNRAPHAATVAARFGEALHELREAFGTEDWLDDERIVAASCLLQTVATHVADDGMHRRYVERGICRFCGPVPTEEDRG